MILVCPNCQASFNVADDAIPATGRNVKCSSCENIWFTFHEPSQPISNSVTRNEVEAPKSEDSVKKSEHARSTNTRTRSRPPAFQQPKLSFFERPSFVILNKLLLITGVMFFFLCLGLRHNEILLKYADYDPELGEFIRETLGLHENIGIRLVAVDCTVGTSNSNKSSEHYNVVEVKIIIENTSKSAQILDAVSFTVFDKDSNNLGTFVMDFMKTLDPGKQEIIEGRLNRIPKSAMFVAIQSANNIDITLRKIDNIFN